MGIQPRRRTPAIRHLAGAAALTIAIGGMPGALWAQEAAPIMPDASAASAPAPLYDSGAAVQPQPPDPIGTALDPGDTATVAIPGGGQVQAQGPTAPGLDQAIPPNETWSGSRIDPNGSGTTPLGP
jgi:hypothetical protein